MKLFSEIIIPFMIISIILYGIYKKNDIYNSFIDGAKEGLFSSINIFPYMISMVFAVNIFLHSGILEYILSFFKIIFNSKVPINIIPMALLRPISGSASEVIMLDIFSKFGPDSFAGRFASTLQGSTDTTFYVITLYFGSVGIKNIRYALKAGLFADFIGILASLVITWIVFGIK